MPEPFGVLPTGFNVKQLHEIIQEIETENAQAAVFGPSIIQTAQSPLGQINALFGDYASDIWQLALAVYQSYDPDQADGLRLDVLAKLRDLERMPGETDIAFRKRITNVGKTDISITYTLNQILAVEGVEWVSVRENSSAEITDLGIPPNTLAFAVKGGTDEAVAQAIYDHTVAGIGLIGNTQLEISQTGYCRSIGFIRPVDVPVDVHITVRASGDLCDCAPASAADIQAAIIADLMGACGLRNGDTVTVSKVRAPAEALPGIEVATVTFGKTGADMSDLPLSVGLFERVAMSASRIYVSFE
ncbi:MAG: hypothetical protein KDJ69_04590 [Nitratireductor sp.]|nr:hypothetical protein [Nitratireductor sp.]